MTVDLLVRAQHIRPADCGGPIALLVLHRLCWRANGDQTVTRTAQRIADELGIGEKTVRRAIRALVDNGVLAHTSKPNGRVPNTYRITFPTRSQ